jgi:acyl-CoA reductase-like NAD-dependent aldehyde dehydrogenase
LTENIFNNNYSDCNKTVIMGDKIITISPNNNEPILERVGPTEAELEGLLKNSLKAFTGYSKNFSLKQRQAIIKKALTLLSSKQDELARELTEQMGRPIAYTAKEIQTAIKRSEYLLKISDDVFADTHGEPEEGFTRYIRKEPVGPVLIIFAWNVSPTGSLLIQNQCHRQFTHLV